MITAIHDVRPTSTTPIFAEMPAGSRSDAPSAAAAAPEQVLEARSGLDALLSSSAEIRAAAVLTVAGEQLASTDGRNWSEAARELWKAAGAAGDLPVTQIHVAEEAGEIFAVSDGNMWALATTDRFSLASLTFCDLRALLRGIPRVGEA